MAFPYFDIYVLSNERNTAVIEKFLARYCDREANEIRESEQEINIYKNEKYGTEEQCIPIETLTEVIEHGTKHFNHAFCFYISHHLKGVKDVMLKFTYDGKMVFGVSIETGQGSEHENYPYALQLAGEIKKITNGYKSNITNEYPPSSDEDEFDEDTAMWKNMNDEFTAQYIHHNPGKAYTLQIIHYLEQLCLLASDKMVTEQSTEKQCLTHIVHEAKELVKYNEWFVALEMILVNLDEIDYKLDAHWVNIAQKIIDLVAISRPEVRKQYAWLSKLKK